MTDEMRRGPYDILSMFRLFRAGVPLVFSSSSLLCESSCSNLVVSDAE